MSNLATPHGDIKLPTFLPDGTVGVVRAVDSADLASCSVSVLMVNTLHLGTHPGGSAVAGLGGIHHFMNWPRPLASDSGGFQVYSLIANDPKRGAVGKDGFSYRTERGGAKKKLTPEKCIQKQFQLGSDVLFCLDYCTHPDADASVQRESVDLTIQWAARCKAEFQRQLEQRRFDAPRPLLFAVVQGGHDRDLRAACADSLLELGFDGFGFGGWPIDDDGRLVDAVSYVSDLIPHTFPKHALGIGKPENVVRAFRAGYRMFDCVIPTRDARHKRLYVFEPGASLEQDAFYRCQYADRECNVRDSRPIEEGCDCPCCRAYSRAYVHHLFQINDHLAYRLATIHNLRFYTRLMELLHAGASSVPTP